MEKICAVARPRLTVAVAVCMMVGVAGCSSDDHAANPPAPATSSALPSVPGFPPGVVPATDLPVDVPNVVELRKQVTMSDCVKTPSGWSAGGEVTNPGGSAEGFRITVFFTDEHATVIDSATTTVNVPENGKASWKAAKEFGTPPTTLCVLRGVGRA